MYGQHGKWVGKTKLIILVVCKQRYLYVEISLSSDSSASQW